MYIYAVHLLGSHSETNRFTTHNKMQPRVKFRKLKLSLALVVQQNQEGAAPLLRKAVA